MSRVAVIGAGVGGLACAIRLAAAGHQVTVLEQADVVGGKLGRYERRTAEGVFRFDTGPSLYTLPQVFADLFDATAPAVGRADLDLIRLDPVLRHVFADGTVLDSSSNPDEFARQIRARIGTEAAAEWERLWLRAGRVWDAAWRHVLRSNVDSLWTLARLAWRLGDLVAISPGRTLRGVGHSYLSDPRLRMLLDRYATYTGSDPRRAPAALLAVPYAELTFGGWYLRGGLSTLVDALVRRCEDVGVEIRVRARVTDIETAGGRVTGVRLINAAHHLPGGAESMAVESDEMEFVAADVVVANADAATVYSELLPRPHRAAKLARRSLGGFVLLLGVRGTTAGLAHHTVFFPADYDAEFDAIFGQPARPVCDPTILVTVADDPAVRPAGHEAWFILVNAPPHGDGPHALDWRTPELADAYADHVLATLATRGIDVRDRIVFREVRTPADLADATRTPGGAIYGTPSHGVTGLLRPPNRGAVRGLYLVGGSTHPGGGLPMVGLSAEIVARTIGPRRSTERRV